MRRVVVLCIFFICGTNVALAESIFTVELDTRGDAHWIMEKRIPLTKPEINEWEAFLKSGQNISRFKDISEFEGIIQQFNYSAQNFSNRSMEFQDFTISYDTIQTLSEGFGVIRYSFWWKNFSRTDSESILVGDAFPEGLILSSDNVLIISIPDGYDVRKVSPHFDVRDGNRLIWEGKLYHNFSKGEPALVLSWGNATNATGTEKIDNEPFPWMSGVFFGIIFILIIIASIISRKRSRSLKESPEEDLESRPLPQLTEEILGYEEMVEKCLERSGGQAYQSEIVKETGLSKSKISVVLAQMKEEGRILKIRKGKENIIRLAVKK